MMSVYVLQDKQQKVYNITYINKKECYVFLICHKHIYNIYLYMQFKTQQLQSLQSITALMINLLNSKFFNFQINQKYFIQSYIIINILMVRICLSQNRILIIQSKKQKIQIFIIYILFIILFQMQINIKLKFLQQKQINHIHYLSLQDQKSTVQHFLDNTTEIPSKINTFHHSKPSEIDKIQSQRQNFIKNNNLSSITPKYNISRRISQSKQLINTSQKKRLFKQNSAHSKKKQSNNSNLTQKKKNSIFSKTQNTKINKKSQANNLNKLQKGVFVGKIEGLQGKKVLKLYSQYLTQTQKIQVINQKQIYYIGNKNKMMMNQDDKQGNYVWQKHDHIGFRYELIEKLGSGSFGEVAKCFDHKTKKYVAIKIIKSNKQYTQFALNQIKILMIIKEKDVQSQKNCVKIKDFLVFRNHMCLVFQLLSLSLYQLLKLNQFKGIKMDFIRRFAIQIFNALSFLEKNKIIHSDIKPENILLKSSQKTGIKIIDFGTSMLENSINYEYIQSRFYRAPQIILGKKHGCEIDMWSVGCLLAELYLGSPLFAGQSQQQQLSLIFQAIGIPSKEYLKNCKKCVNFFYTNLTPKLIKTKEGIVILPETKPLSKRIQDKQFLSFLDNIFVYEQNQRLKPLQALIHPWILQGLPKQIKKQHLCYIKEQLKIIDNSKKELSELQKSSSKKKKKRSDRISELYSQKKTIQKHQRRRSDGLY